MWGERVLLVLAGLLIGACATSGSVPLDPSGAVIESDATIIDSIDEHNVREEGPGAANARFEIPAGHHAVAVSLRSSAGAGATPPIIVCFAADPGHSYRTRPVFEQGRWRPAIEDEATGSLVQRACTPHPAVAQDTPAAPPRQPGPTEPVAADSTVAQKAPPSTLAAPTYLHRRHHRAGPV